MFDSSKMGGATGGGGGGGGEQLQIHRGQVVRSTVRKDRHSKVYTAKGIRDRRVRLSAHTAILFYDVQDRLGYDRPSKAVDWLIRNAKDAIDKLSGVPVWHPSDDRANSNGAFPMSEIGTAADSEGLKNLATSGFVTDASNTVMDMISVKDLGLSLQSFQAQKQQEQAALFASPTGSLSTGSAVGGRYSRMPDELSFNRPPPPQQPTVGINGAAAGGCYFQQRGTLQSSLSTPVHEHSFNFGDRFTSEGFPGFCLSSQFHSEEGSNSNPI
ncbi:hypothetical protein SAY87_017603 [Trapa incisa]|uniref:TCP domain-containing protein n=1 Tax=Trapa incisa TaxID=236973 RepID=A0AAN7L1W9_9MYRT|nr:hypothetical protein SAY87_017603 [Trapa incisa]